MTLFSDYNNAAETENFVQKIPKNPEYSKVSYNIFINVLLYNICYYFIIIYLEKITSDLERAPSSRPR